MKTYKYFLEEIASEMKTGCFDLSLITELAAIRYAKQCCEDLRERISDNIEGDTERGYIMSTEIILP